MEKQNLVDYVKEELEKGISQDQFKKTLIEQGWSEEEIEEALIFKEKKSFLRKNIFKIIVIALFLIFFASIFVLFSLNKEEKCVEDWNCVEWSVCTNNERSRICVDLNECGTFKEKPILIKECLSQEEEDSSILPETKSPKEIYVEYIKEFEKINNSYEFINLGKKYASKKLIAEIEEIEKELEQMTEEFREMMFSTVKEIFPSFSQIIEIREEIKNNSAILIIETSIGTTGDIKMIKEDEEWKIDSELWKD